MVNIKMRQQWERPYENSLLKEKFRALSLVSAELCNTYIMQLHQSLAVNKSCDICFPRGYNNVLFTIPMQKTLKDILISFGSCMHFSLQVLSLYSMLHCLNFKNGMGYLQEIHLPLRYWSFQEQNFVLEIDQTPQWLPKKEKLHMETNIHHIK